MKIHSRKHLRFADRTMYPHHLTFEERDGKIEHLDITVRVKIHEDVSHELVHDLLEELKRRLQT